MDIPVIAGEYNQGSWGKSRKPMGLQRRHEMRPDSPALRAEQLCFPNQTHKEPRFAWLNSREYTTTMSQEKKNTDVTSGMQNRSVCPKSNWDEAKFPCIGSITITRSESYRTRGLTPFMKLQRFLETPLSIIEDHQYQYSNLRKHLCITYHLGMRMIPCLLLKR